MKAIKQLFTIKNTFSKKPIPFISVPQNRFFMPSSYFSLFSRKHTSGKLLQKQQSHYTLYAFALIITVAYANTIHTMNTKLPTTLSAADKALFAAIESENRDEVSNALQNANANTNTNANANAVDNNSYTPLMRAIYKKSMPIIELLLDNQADIHAVDKWGKTPLATAAYMGLVPAVELLLTLNADIDILDHDNNTPLMHACQYISYGLGKSNNHTSIAKILLARNADIEVKNKKDGCNALMHAVRVGNQELAQLLINHKADINAFSDEIHSHTYTPLMHAVIGSTYTFAHMPTARMLIQNKADINAINKNGETALIHSITMNHGTATYLLLNNKANVHHAKKDGYTALAYAALHDRASLIKPLLEHGADLEAHTDWGRTPLMAALKPNSIVTVEALLEHKAEVNAADTKDGYTPLMLAIIMYPYNTDIAQLLLDKKANVNALDKQQKTALRHAIEKNRSEVLEMLIVAGAECDSTAADGITPLQAANPEMQQIMVTAVQKRAEREEREKQEKQQREQEQQQKHKQKINKALLRAAINNDKKSITEALDKGATIDTVDPIGRTPLMWAIFYGYVDIVDMLLTEGACVHVTDHYGHTALAIAHELAQDKHRDEIVRMIRNKKEEKRKAAQLHSLEKVITAVQKQDALAQQQDALVQQQDDEEKSDYLVSALLDFKALLVTR